MVIGEYILVFFYYNQLLSIFEKKFYEYTY